jgi:hypothetical protein
MNVATVQRLSAFAAVTLAVGVSLNGVVQKLFGPVNGIGPSFLRNPVGGCDQARYGYSFNDLPAG